MLTYDGKIYRWSSSLPDLKSFVEKTLNLKGSWNSPGGDAKLFCFTGSKFILKWHGSKSQKLAIQADHTQCLVLRPVPKKASGAFSINMHVLECDS